MNKLYGAILGDLAGQPYEFNYKGDFSEFNLHDERSHITDDTIMTIATVAALVRNEDFGQVYKEFGLANQGDFYGKKFKEWLESEPGTMNDSFGNGCLMRLSPIMYFSASPPVREHLVVSSCLNSHRHAISIVSALRLYNLYRLANEEERAKRFANYSIDKFEKFEVRADKTIDFIERVFWHTNLSTQKTIELVVKCGGDTDTNASIIGELMNYTLNDLTEKDVEYVDRKVGEHSEYLLACLRSAQELLT